MTNIPKIPRIGGRLAVAPHLRPKPRRVARGDRCERIVMIPRDWGLERRFVSDWIDPQDAAGNVTAQIFWLKTRAKWVEARPDENPDNTLNIRITGGLPDE